MQQLDLSSLSASTAEPSSVLPSSPTTEAGHLDDPLGPLGSTKVRYEDSLRSVKDSQRSTMASPRSIMDVTMQQRQRPEPADRPETRTTGFLLKKASQFPYNWKERFCVFDKDRHELAGTSSQARAQGRHATAEGLPLNLPKIEAVILTETSKLQQHANS